MYSLIGCWFDTDEVESPFVLIDGKFDTEVFFVRELYTEFNFGSEFGCINVMFWAELGGFGLIISCIWRSVSVKLAGNINLENSRSTMSVVTKISTRSALSCWLSYSLIVYVFISSALIPISFSVSRLFSSWNWFYAISLRDCLPFLRWILR